MPRSIAKVNAESIDGYFGEGTPCFFIRGTILSDCQVEGDYPTLQFMRAGNHIEVMSFDGTYAVVTITTRPGNREGDGVRARLFFHDGDLKTLGIDCAHIADVKGLPFAFDVEELAGGLFGEHAAFAYPLPLETPAEADFMRDGSDDRDAAFAALQTPELLRAAIADVEPATVIVELEPVDAHASAAQPDVPTTAEPESAPVPERSAAARELFDLGKLFELLRGQGGRNPLVDIGATVAAAAVPMLVYLALEFFKNRAPEDGDGER